MKYLLAAGLLGLVLAAAGAADKTNPPPQPATHATKSPTG